MSSVKIRFLSLLADAMSAEKIVLSFNNQLTIESILDKLAAEFGKDFVELIYGPSKKEKLSKFIITILNGKDIRSINGLTTIVQDGDEISFMPAIAGG